MNNKTFNILKLMIARLDARINKQLSLIINSSNFKNLLETWTELQLLTDAITNPKIKVNLLNLSYSELEHDIDSNLDIESSQCYRIVYESNLGTAGGQPITTLVTQFYFDIIKNNIANTLLRLTELASINLSPLLTNVSEESIQEYYDLRPFKKGSTHKIYDLQSWQSKRQNQCMRFLFLAAPSAIYTHNHHTLTIKPSILITLGLIKSFNESNWFLDLNGDLSIGKIPFLSKYLLNSNDAENFQNIGITNLVQESTKKFINISNITSCFSSRSNALSTLEPLITACFLGHHIKAIAQNKIGSLLDEKDCEKAISHWLNKYKSSSNSHSSRRLYPLRSFDIQILPIPGKVGCYNCRILLEPHMKFDTLTAKIILNSEILVPDLI